MRPIDVSVTVYPRLQVAGGTLEHTYLRRCDPGLGAADGAWQDGTGLVVPRQDLRHAPMGHPQLATDVTRPGTE
jgi:hypothetical protein